MKKSEGKINPSIQCSVYQCTYNSNEDEYCTLDKIQVGTHENDPTMDECTDCQSFQKK